MPALMASWSLPQFKEPLGVSCSGHVLDSWNSLGPGLGRDYGVSISNPDLGDLRHLAASHSNSFNH
jgi:hypothetical protein